MGKGTTSPKDELAKGQAIQKALEHRELLDINVELRDLAVSTTGDMVIEEMNTHKKSKA